MLHGWTVVIIIRQVTNSRPPTSTGRAWMAAGSWRRNESDLRAELNGDGAIQELQVASDPCNANSLSSSSRNRQQQLLLPQHHPSRHNSRRAPAGPTRAAEANDGDFGEADMFRQGGGAYGSVSSAMAASGEQISSGYLIHGS
eukprot:GHVU01037583.1.p3 GENE.GHVU01037583.1~~GHVU01037583.1.p3  ORF type:complete len:143 (+),score=18.33 GHVU01037583.1:193-621(+)